MQVPCLGLGTTTTMMMTNTVKKLLVTSLFLCVWHRFVELVRRGKCKRYSKYNWRFSFHASNTSWILALKFKKWSVFHMTQLLRRKLKVKLKTKLHRKVQCRWYNLAGNRSIYSCVTQILFPYAVFAGLVLIFFGVQHEMHSSMKSYNNPEAKKTKK